MTGYDGTRVKVQVLLRGYEQALVRFNVAATGRIPEPAFHAGFECLNWAHAVDDLIGEVWRPEGRRQGFEWRGWISGGEVMDGIRYARNRVHHQWADALVLVDGEMRFPMQSFSWVWCSVNDLPTPDGRRADPNGHTAYGALLAGQRAEDSLLLLADVFRRVEAFLAPPELERRRVGN